MATEQKANLFVVGAMRTGTTSFMEFLGSHSEIYTSPIKEPNFFVESMPASLYSPGRYFSLDTYFEVKFPKPLHIANLKTVHEYNKLFSLAGTQKYRTEGSTAYLHAPNAAKRIHDYNPDAKIIIITRAPIDRAYSHYVMDKGLGRTLQSFNALIENELQLAEKNMLPWYSYLSMSCYRTPIRNYTSLFPDVLVLSFEQLYGDFVGHDALYDFLEIERDASVKLPHLNASTLLRGQHIYTLLHRVGIKDYFSKMVGNRTKQRLFKKLPTKLKEEAVLTPERKAKVLHFFAKEE